MTSQQPERLIPLDSLRAIAILSVVFYHYFFFWTPASRGAPLVAYGDAFAGIPFVAVDYLGVNLFFVISGFVILLTLERTTNMREFFLGRAARLWPPLIIFGTVTMLIVTAFGPPELRVGWQEYSLSLLLLPPQHAAMMTGASGWKWLDGAYWSLFVEVKFYVVIGLLYFAFPKRVVTAWLGFELLTILVGLQAHFVGGRRWDMLDGFLFEPFVPYFSFGIASYAIFSGRRSASVLVLTGIAIAHVCFTILTDSLRSPLTNYDVWGQVVIGHIAIFGIFYLFAWRGINFKLLSWAPLARVGRASYGIYLLHQNVGITILSLPLLTAPLLGLVGACAVAFGIAVTAILVFERLERPLLAYLRQRLLKSNFHRQAVPDPLS